MYVHIWGVGNIRNWSVEEWTFVRMISGLNVRYYIRLAQVLVYVD